MTAEKAMTVYDSVSSMLGNHQTIYTGVAKKDSLLCE